MPTYKSKKIEDALTSLAPSGLSRQEAESLGVCTWCKQEVKGFKDEQSETEYGISGWCQECQDRTFNTEYTA